MYTDYEIRQMPLSVGRYRRLVEEFLAKNHLRMATDMDYYAAVFRRDDDEILAGGGLAGNVIKCIAVGEDMREEGFSSRLISHLVSQAVSFGHNSVKVFTKPENKQIFESMAFVTLAASEKAILMENGQQGLSVYVKYLQQIYKETISDNNSVCGVIVMNANPFTLGHRYLIEQAAKQVDCLFIIAVKEDISDFSYSERLRMITDGCSDIGNVSVCEGSDYQISKSTFPTYFLKKLDDATDTHILLDLQLFCQHIAPALNATIRFVGTEPTDNLTRRYNELMKKQLPEHGIEVKEINRLTTDMTVSASLVRKHIEENKLHKASKYVPSTTLPFLVSHLAVNALYAELGATPKPGLVDRHDNGAHHDMDYEVMKRSIESLRPSFTRLAIAGFCGSRPTTDEIRTIGIEAEKAMLVATRGVNTHKGALFAMGLTIVAASHLLYILGSQKITAAELQREIKQLAASFPSTEGTHGANVSLKHPKVVGALAIAKGGYSQLFECWLPYFRLNKEDNDIALRTLLLIMSQIDDTNIYHRRGEIIAEQVKKKAKEIFDNFSTEALCEMNRHFISENISPGGAADMLALTIFIDAITTSEESRNT